MLPLEGIKVVEMGIWVAAPAASMLLADWGADVIKIEDPAGGDAWRNRQPGEPGDFSFRFEFNNRNKRSVAINLKSEAGRAIAIQLIAGADVFVSNLREEVLNSFGLTYEALSELNPRLIYAHISGYGRKGADAKKAGFDLGAYWARGGFMGNFGEEGTPPVSPYAGLGDQPTGGFVAGGIALALFARERTGLGMRVDGALLASAVWIQAHQLGTVQWREFPRFSRRRVLNPLSTYYRTKDDKYLMLLMLQPDRYWSEFCRVLGIEHLEHDPRFADINARGTYATDLIPLLEEVFATRTQEEWVEHFNGTNLLYDKASMFAEIVNDPQVLENGFLTEFDHPRQGKIRVPVSPVQFDSSPGDVKSPAPELGEHTESVLLEMGYDWEQIIRLKEEGAIL